MTPIERVALARHINKLAAAASVSARAIRADYEAQVAAGATEAEAQAFITRKFTDLAAHKARTGGRT